MAARLAVVREPGSVAPTLYPSAGGGCDLVTEVGIEAKLARISDGISENVRNAVRDAATPSEGMEPFRASGPGESPIIVLERIDAMFRENEAIIDGIMSHLVEHIVIREDLRLQAERVRVDADAESRRIPAFLEDMAIGLVEAGVIWRDVRTLSSGLIPTFGARA